MLVCILARSRRRILVSTCLSISQPSNFEDFIRVQSRMHARQARQGEQQALQGKVDALIEKLRSPQSVNEAKVWPLALYRSATG